MKCRFEKDNLGAYGEVDIDLHAYPSAAVFKAAYWLTDRYYIYLFCPREGALVVQIRSKSSNIEPERLTEALGEFCNSVLDFAVRQVVLDETRGIREELVKKAFREGVRKPGLDSARSREGHLPTADSDYTDDPAGTRLR